MKPCARDVSRRRLLLFFPGLYPRDRLGPVPDRDGWRYPGFDLELFRKLRRKKAVSSTAGCPYRITRRGLQLVRAEFDNR
ncbi:hypothetical protein EN852_013080 [Mesorhizobium sp. M2E.F.Ca.ET.209.01.1.1]|nr:hypothetical protein EN852_013080 [Mesorhizobium sp. M2E.F.Ca.ET.209.01.1.1]